MLYLRSVSLVCSEKNLTFCMHTTKLLTCSPWFIIVPKHSIYMRMGYTACLIQKPHGASHECHHGAVIAVHLIDHPVFVPLPSVSNIILTLLVVDTITGGRVLPQRFFIKVLFFPSGLVSVIVRESYLHLRWPSTSNAWNSSLITCPSSTSIVSVLVK